VPNLPQEKGFIGGLKEERTIKKRGIYRENAKQRLGSAFGRLEKKRPEKKTCEGKNSQTRGARGH